jgi:hypothetical protein
MVSESIESHNKRLIGGTNMSKAVMNQKEAVYQAMVNVCGEQDEAYAPTKEERAQVNNILFEGFQQGNISFDGALPESSKLKAYVSGLQSNWLRKDPRLNGNTKYVAKNPGSRAGSTDTQVKAMRILLSTKTDSSERAEIQTFIDKRLAEIKPAKSTELTAEQIAVLEAAGLGHFVSQS